MKKVRISGTTQLVPSIIATNRQETLAIRWMLEAAAKRRMNRKSMSLDQCRRMGTCNRLDLQTLGSQPVLMPKNLPDH